MRRSARSLVQGARVWADARVLPEHEALPSRIAASILGGSDAPCPRQLSSLVHPLADTTDHWQKQSLTSHHARCYSAHADAATPAADEAPPAASATPTATPDAAPDAAATTSAAPSSVAPPGRPRRSSGAGGRAPGERTDSSASLENRKFLQHYMHSCNNEGRWQECVDKVDEYVRMGLRERREHTGPGVLEMQFALDADIVSLYLEAEKRLASPNSRASPGAKQRHLEGAAVRLERILQNLHDLHIKTKAVFFDRANVALFRVYFETCARGRMSAKAEHALAAASQVHMHDVVTDARCLIFLAHAYLREGSPALSLKHGPAVWEGAQKLDEEKLAKALEVLGQAAAQRLQGEDAQGLLWGFRELLRARCRELGVSDARDSSDFDALALAWVRLEEASQRHEAYTARAPSGRVLVDHALAVEVLQVITLPKMHRVALSDTSRQLLASVIANIEGTTRAKSLQSSSKVAEGVMLATINTCAAASEPALALRALHLAKAVSQHPYTLSDAGAKDAARQKGKQGSSAKANSKLPDMTHLPSPACYLGVAYAFAKARSGGEKNSLPERAKSIFGVVGELCEDYSPVLAELRDPDFLDPASALKPAVKLFGQNEESWNAAYQVLEESRVAGARVHIAQYNLLMQAAVALKPVVDEAGAAVDIVDPSYKHHIYKSINMMDHIQDVAASDPKNAHLTPNTQSYNSIIDGMCQSGFVTGISAILQEMKEKSIPKDQVTFHLLLSYFLTQEQIQGFVATIQDMSEVGILPEARILTAAMHTARKLGLKDERYALQHAMDQQGLRDSAPQWEGRYGGGGRGRAPPPREHRPRVDDRGRVIR